MKCINRVTMFQNKRNSLFLIFCGIFAIVAAAEGSKTYVIKADGDDVIDDNAEENWWKTAVFYQIYPRSFKDSNGDGIGDLRGIIEKLQHLKDAGVTATWLSPVYKSPQVDQGYDISDFRDVDPIFGNLTDLKELIDTAHNLGIRVILDFVPNHSSDQHEWFIKSVAGDPQYADYYVWVNGTKGTPPNNWLSSFKGSAWEWNEQRQQYYLHQFSTGQPDLNYRNPKVVQEMKDILKYWMDFGADGFRMDAVFTIFEDAQLRDEPLSGDPTSTPIDYNYLDHIYTANQNETIDMIYQFREVLNEYNKNSSSYKVMMTEVYAKVEQVMLYYGTSDGQNVGAHFSFNFNFITDLSSNFSSVDEIINCMDSWLSAKPKQFINNWVLGNHDQHRVASRFGKENVDAFNMLVAILPGVQVTYDGEEIGMENGEVTCSQGFDPQAIKNCSTFDANSRDFERTPFQWDNTKNAGFSTAEKTWLPVGSTYKTVNLAAQSVQGQISHFHIYQDLLKLRNNFKNVKTDSLTLDKISEKVLKVTRKIDSMELVYLFNIANEDQSLPNLELDFEPYVLIASVNSTSSVGEKFNKNSLVPHESLILAPHY